MNKRYFRQIENHDYDPMQNGEKWLIRTLASRGLIRTCFDVGANRGDWSAIVLEESLEATIHAFEPCALTYHHLQTRFAENARVRLNPVGLLDVPGEVDIHYCWDRDELSSMINVIYSKNHFRSKVAVTTGREYCGHAGIHEIDLLKLDVEGVEKRVMDGFGSLLNPSCTKVIQFEYGQLNIITKVLLRDYYDYLSARGYVIGKLMKDHIRIRKYKMDDENFLGPNYVAVDERLAGLLGPR